MIDLKIKRLHPDAIIPKYQTEGAACFDLHACEPQAVPLGMSNPGNASATFPTGLSFDVPAGHAMLVFSRSGHGFENGLRLANCVGVIDSDYRGEVMVRLHSDTQRLVQIGHGDRIAQAMLVELPRVRLLEVDELSETVRGNGGFGSTGS